MAGTFTHLTFHIIFGTKYRRNTIAPDFREELYRYIGGVIRNHKGTLLEIGGTGDHVHLLIGLNASTCVADIVRVIKSNSSKWINERPDRVDRFEWQTGYAAFTVSCSQVESVRRYIQNQDDHHREWSFRDEYIAFLKRHGIDFEERYVR